MRRQRRKKDVSLVCFLKTWRMRRNNHVKTGRRDPKVPLLEKSWYTQVSLRWTVGLEHRERGERKKIGGGQQLSGGSSVAESCPTLCNPMDCSRLGFPVHHQLPKLAQTHVHRVSDAIQPSHSLSSPSPPTFNVSQSQGPFQWGSSLYQVAKVLKLQLQHQFFQWIFRTDLL